jgi:hypothetical protein
MSKYILYIYTPVNQKTSAIGYPVITKVNQLETSTYLLVNRGTWELLTMGKNNLVMRCCVQMGELSLFTPHPTFTYFHVTPPN